MKIKWFFNPYSLIFLTSIRLCNADILFIDTNNSPEEVEAAKEAAKIRGEKVVVFPLRTPEQDKILLEIRQLEIQRGKVNVGAEEAVRRADELNRAKRREERSPHPDPEKIKQYNAELVANTAKYHEEEDKVEPQLDAIDVQENALGNQVEVLNGRSSESGQIYQGKFSSIVISGHHDSGTYMGILGSIKQM